MGNVKDSAFLFTGFGNWKDVTVAFGSHEMSATRKEHKRAVEGVITLPQTTRDVGDLLSSAHAAEKCKNRQCLTTIIESISFLARQGIALHGDLDESDGNFTQLLRLRGVDQPHLLTWLERKTDKYTSPQVQNKILAVMASIIVWKHQRNYPKGSLLLCYG